MARRLLRRRSLRDLAICCRRQGWRCFRNKEQRDKSQGDIEQVCGPFVNRESSRCCFEMLHFVEISACRGCDIELFVFFSSCVFFTLCFVRKSSLCEHQWCAFHACRSIEWSVEGFLWPAVWALYLMLARQYLCLLCSQFLSRKIAVYILCLWWCFLFFSKRCFGQFLLFVYNHAAAFAGICSVFSFYEHLCINYCQRILVRCLDSLWNSSRSPRNQLCTFNACSASPLSCRFCKFASCTIGLILFNTYSTLLFSDFWLELWLYLVHVILYNTQWTFICFDRRFLSATKAN